MRFSTLSLIFALILAIASPLKAVIVVSPPAATEAGIPTKADIAAATAEYKAKLATMTAKERRAFKKEQKRDMQDALRNYKQETKDGLRAADDESILLIILAVLLPPLAVYLHQGEVNDKFWISLILTILGWFPGVIYALLLVTGTISKK